MTKGELRQMIREVLKEELSQNGITSNSLRKLAIHEIVNIIPEQGPRQRYKQELKTPTSWSDFQNLLNKKLLDLKEEILEYGNDVDDYLDPTLWDLTDPDEAAEYAEMQQKFDDQFSINWPEIKKLIDAAKPGAIITLFEIDYEDYDVSWSGSIKYIAVIL